MCLFLFYFVLFRIRLLRVEKLAEKHSGPLQLWSHTVDLPNLSGSRRAKLITIHLSGTDRNTETLPASAWALLVLFDWRAKDIGGKDERQKTLRTEKRTKDQKCLFSVCQWPNIQRISSDYKLAVHIQWLNTMAHKEVYIQINNQSKP